MFENWLFGISSAIAIPALSGIPVTHRSVSRGVHIVTAHSADTEDGLPEEPPAADDVPVLIVMPLGGMMVISPVMTFCQLSSQ